MKDHELEGRLKKLAIKKMRPEFKESLLGEIRKRETLPARSSWSQTLVLNCALSLAAVAIISLARITSSASLVQEITRTPDPAIVAAGAELYPPQALTFLAQSLTVESPSFKPQSEVQL